MTYERALEIIQPVYPSAIVEGNKRSGFTVLDQPRAWEGGIGGHFTCTAISSVHPTLKGAVMAAANRILGERIERAA